MPFTSLLIKLRSCPFLDSNVLLAYCFRTLTLCITEPVFSDNETTGIRSHFLALPLIKKLLVVELSLTVLVSIYLFELKIEYTIHIWILKDLTIFNLVNVQCWNSQRGRAALYHTSWLWFLHWHYLCWTRKYFSKPWILLEHMEVLLCFILFLLLATIINFY